MAFIFIQSSLLSLGNKLWDLYDEYSSQLLLQLQHYDLLECELRINHCCLSSPKPCSLFYLLLSKYSTFFFKLIFTLIIIHLSIQQLLRLRPSFRKLKWLVRRGSCQVDLLKIYDMPDKKNILPTRSFDQEI